MFNPFQKLQKEQTTQRIADFFYLSSTLSKQNGESLLVLGIFNILFCLRTDCTITAQQDITSPEFPFKMSLLWIYFLKLYIILFFVYIVANGP